MKASVIVEVLLCLCCLATHAESVQVISEGWDFLAWQLSCFISCMGTVLRNISSLSIVFQCEDSSTEENSEVLLYMLADVCSSLCKLQHTSGEECWLRLENLPANSSVWRLLSKDRKQSDETASNYVRDDTCRMQSNTIDSTRLSACLVLPFAFVLFFIDAYRHRLLLAYSRNVAGAAARFDRSLLRFGKQGSS